jgi:hypothetical protein
MSANNVQMSVPISGKSQVMLWSVIALFCPDLISWVRKRVERLPVNDYRVDKSDPSRIMWEYQSRKRSRAST